MLAKLFCRTWGSERRESRCPWSQNWWITGQIPRSFGTERDVWTENRSLYSLWSWISWWCAWLHLLGFPHRYAHVQLVGKLIPALITSMVSLFEILIVLLGGAIECMHLEAKTMIIPSSGQHRAFRGWLKFCRQTTCFAILFLCLEPQELDFQSISGLKPASTP